MAATYELKEPLVLTGRGPLWRAVGSDGQPRVIRFISDEAARAHAGRLEILADVRHDNLMRVIEATHLDGRYAIVCEEVEGTALNVLLNQPGSLTPRRARAIAADIARGLQALHHAGVAHGDVSPANVIVGEAAVLIDLIDAPGVTPSYAAPELSEDNGYGADLSFDERCRSDIWSWGQIVRAMGVHVPFDELALCDDPGKRPSIDDVVEAQGGARDEGMPPTDANLLESSPASLLRSETDRERTRHRHAPARHRRSRRARRSHVVGIAVGVLAVAVLAIYAVHGGASVASHADARPAAVDASHVCPTDRVATDIVRNLTGRRAVAVMEADPSALAAVYTDDARLKERDTAMINRLQKQHMTIENLSTSIVSVRVVDCGEHVTVRATVAQDAHARCSHGICATIAAQEPHDVIVELVGPPWRVDTVTRG